MSDVFVVSKVKRHLNYPNLLVIMLESYFTPYGQDSQTLAFKIEARRSRKHRTCENCYDKRTFLNLLN